MHLLNSNRRGHYNNLLCTNNYNLIDFVIIRHIAIQYRVGWFSCMTLYNVAR